MEWGKKELQCPRPCGPQPGFSHIPCLLLLGTPNQPKMLVSYPNPPDVALKYREQISIVVCKTGMS